VVPRLPELWLPWLAEALGAAAFVLGRRARETAQANIEPVVGRAASLATARRMFTQNAQYYLSLFSRRPRRFRLEDHELHGWDQFRQALSAGRGCLLVSPHVGDINYYAELFVASGLPVSVLVEELRPRQLSDLVARLRQRRGVGVIVGGSGALRQIYRALDRNEIVAIISDRDLTGDGEPVRFFGGQTTMPATAFTIAARRRTPVVFGTAVRLADGRIVTDVRAPFVPCEPRAEVQRMADVFEEFIRRWPDQWLAFQPIFRAERGVPAAEPANRAAGTQRAARRSGLRTQDSHG
jgi:lauroyl/myristoyl acyltransferase